MPTFERAFKTTDLSRWDAGNPGNAVRALFEKWALPGQDWTKDRPLRLAVRDGYLNFYFKGQSVAKLSIGQGGPKLEVHKAYVTGRRRGMARHEAAPSQPYHRVDAKRLADHATIELVESWIETAETYASAEKRFVDDLVAANPGTLDLEMGLPANEDASGCRVAPRMDLVVAQVNGKATPSIEFWEAKCADNGELRASKPYEECEDGSFVGPKVLNQVSKYVSWMQGPNRIQEVSSAYTETAKALLDLHRLFHGDTDRHAECLSVWRTLAGSDAPVIIVQPGVVIGNYWPGGHHVADAHATRMERNAATFTENGHRKELKRNGVCVYEVGPDHGGPLLPVLALQRLAA
ncbi:hypothetical protein [uncultured Jannaschia sp.]|uniref:hypothetical protein n=1 Tax=uncultured Jannaschia sp. TaxID=293347 RepID=UPI002604BA53|nr:hypothetical protein [uncultured Jannaschia sp.]